MASLEVGDEGFHGNTRTTLSESLYEAYPMACAQVREVVAVNTGKHHMLKTQFLHTVANIVNLLRVKG